MKGEMERKKKLIVFFSIFAGVYLAFILCSLICRYGLHLEYPYGSFLFFREDAFKDFSTINGAVKDRNPYLSGLSNYPPFILFIAFFFARAGNPEVYHEPLGDAIYDPKVKATFIALVVIFVVAMLVIALVFKKSKKDIPMNLAVMTALIISAPSIFMIDRGNYLMITIIFFMLFALYEEYHPEKNNGAVFASLAAATKIYPAFMLFMYPLDKKYKKLIIAIFTGAFVTIVPIFFMRGAFMDNFYEFVTSALGFGHGSVGYYSVYFNVGLTGLLSFIYRVLGMVPNTAVIKNFWLMGSVAVAGIAFLFTLKEKKLWKKLFVLTSAMVFVTPNSFLYNSMYLAPSIYLMLTDEKKISKRELPYVISAALLMAPKAFYYLKDLGGYPPMEFNTVNIAVFLDSMLLLFVVCWYVIDRILEFKGTEVEEKARAVLKNDKILTMVLGSCSVLLTLWLLYFLKDTLLACHDSFLEFIYARTETLAQGYKRALEFSLARGRIGFIFPAVVSFRYLIEGTGNYTAVWLLQYVPILMNIALISYILGKKTKAVYGWFFSMFFILFLQVDIWHSLITCYPLDFMYGLFLMILGLWLYHGWLSKLGEKKNTWRLILSVILYYESMQTYEPFLMAAAVYALITFSYCYTMRKEKTLKKSLISFVLYLLPHFFTAVLYYGIIKYVNKHPIVDMAVTSIDQVGNFHDFVIAYKVYTFAMFPLRSARFMGPWYMMFSPGRISKHALAIFVLAFAGCFAGFWLMMNQIRRGKREEIRKLRVTLLVFAASGLLIALFYALPHSLTANYQYWVLELATNGYVPTTICYFGWALFLSCLIAFGATFMAEKKAMMRVIAVVLASFVIALGGYMTSLINSYFKLLPASTGTWTSLKAQTYYALITDEHIKEMKPDIIYTPDFTGVHGNMDYDDLIADRELSYDVTLASDRQVFLDEEGNFSSPMEFKFDDDSYVGFLFVVDDYNDTLLTTSQDIYVVTPLTGKIEVEYLDRSSMERHTVTVDVDEDGGCYLGLEGDILVNSVNAVRLK
ncbi:MAG: DUF2029 domain-containing protein [Clostridiales bacterium]|nr:DUF2029 domain-containing protein [Clostridiales bacterium]